MCGEIGGRVVFNIRGMPADDTGCLGSVEVSRYFPPPVYLDGRCALPRSANTDRRVGVVGISDMVMLVCILWLFMGCSR